MAAANRGCQRQAAFLDVHKRTLAANFVHTKKSEITINEKGIVWFCFVRLWKNPWSGPVKFDDVGAAHVSGLLKSDADEFYDCCKAVSVFKHEDRASS